MRAMSVAGFAVLALVCASASFARSADRNSYSLEQVLSYPFPSGLVSAQSGEHIAWTVNVRGIRNVWVADGPAFTPRQVTHFNVDDGQEITQVAFSPGADALVFVRGGDHDANWLDPANLAPNPAADPDEPKVTVWSVALPGGTAVEVGEGDGPTISSGLRLAYLKTNQVWTTSLDGKEKDKAKRLFFDRGKDRELTWSADGKHLAFVSDRGDHSFIGVYSDDKQPIVYLAPSTSRDTSPRWSPEGGQIAFVRQPGLGGAPESILHTTPKPWSIWTADIADGRGHVVWDSPKTLEGSIPQTAGETNLFWNANSRITFLSDVDGWPHLYSVDSKGGQALLLTPGNFMVEYVAQSSDKRFLVYDANTGSSKDDIDRRHVFKVPVDGAQPIALTRGDGLQGQPVAVAKDRVAFIGAGTQRPAEVAIIDANGANQRVVQTDLVPKDFPVAAMVVPKAVTFSAADGQLIHAQLFQRDNATAVPGVVFVHGGPTRQMLLGWHYMDYYANSYALNQYLAAHGFAVLSINYRLGIGYGHAFQNFPPGWGPTGAAEYQDILAGAKFLQGTRGVDARRIGMWGGSYGGYLTALALARNSDIFKAGVDLHGVHDWSRFVDFWFGPAASRFEEGDRKDAMKTAWESSPDADIAQWKSPVLLIQGDDDRNVQFLQTVDLARRLQEANIPHEELVLPNEVHMFLRYKSWLKVDQATADFLAAKLAVKID